MKALNSIAAASVLWLLIGHANAAETVSTPAPETPAPPATEAALAAVPAVATPHPASVPIRDLVDIRGIRSNQLVGYGLVFGLAGTGDGTQAAFTTQSLANTLRRMGVVVPQSAIRVRNTASVIVTAELPAFARPGARIDVNLASIGDAKSLSGGTLLMTPLRAADGQIYALAQGPVSLGGGFSASGGGASVTKNHATAGIIPGGALVERDTPIDITGRKSFVLQLRNPDFATSHRIEQALRETFDKLSATAVDSGSVAISPPEEMRARPVEFLAAALDVPVRPNVSSRIVLNERTGTVVLGGDVRIGQVSVTHGNLAITVARRFDVSQPAPFSEKGETVVVPSGEVVAEEEEGRGVELAEGARVQDLVNALKKVGVTPRDLIAIFEAIKAAGALHADLVVI